MSIESKKSNKLMLSILSLIVGIGFGVAILLLVTSLEDTKRALNQSKNRAVKLEHDLAMFQSNLIDIKKEYDELKSRPVDVSGDEILERDIFIYIDKKFQLVPRTAALDIAKEIVSKSRSMGVSPELVVGIIQVESSFDASAVSSANARGLMQVMPEWAKKFGLKKVSDLHDIDTGIESGIKVLKIHIEEEGGNLTKGLFKYVGGSDAYAGKVYTAMGKFVVYRSFIPDNYEKQEEKGVDEVSTK